MSERQELTPELRKQLAGYLPFSNDATTEYTPDFYLKKDQVWDEEKKEFKDTETYLIPDGYRPVFKLRCFTKAEYTKVQKLLQDERQDKEKVKQLERAIETKQVLRAIVLGWTDLFDIGKIEEIPYKADPKGGCDKDLFDKIPDWVTNDIQYYVFKMSGIVPGERISLK